MEILAHFYGGRYGSGLQILFMWNKNIKDIKNSNILLFCHRHINFTTI